MTETNNHVSKIIPNLVLAIMCKNEEKRITASFDSVKEYIDKFFIFDTGSTDNTINVINNYCETNKIKLFLKQGTFVDFSTSRNELLQFVDDNLTEQHYVLLLDTNDEMKEMDNLKQFIETYKGPCSGFHLRQRWWTGTSLDTYLNIRMIKSHKNWRYKCVVHEYITCPEIGDNQGDENIIYKLENVIVYQDRTVDDDKSFKRFFRDKDLLYKEYQKDNKDSRTLFYLAQTASCLGNHEEAYMYYLLRIKEIGFCEEVYQSYYRLGEISAQLGHEWEESMMWYIKAFQHSQRVEPLISIIQYYIKNNINNEKEPEWHTAYMFASMACKLVWPQNQILFINKKHYTYTRWHLMSKIAKHVGRYDEGKRASIVAVEAENKDDDKDNLKFYLEKELEILHQMPIGGRTLIAITLGPRELRLQQEFDKIHDSKKIIGEHIKNILDIKYKEKYPLDPNKIMEFCNNNEIKYVLPPNLLANISDNHENLDTINNLCKVDSKTISRRQKLKNKLINNKTNGEVKK